MTWRGPSSTSAPASSSRASSRGPVYFANISGEVKTFFDNSAEQAVAALLELKGPKLSEAELERVARLIADAKKEGR